MPTPDLAALFRLRPDRAADYLLAKGLKLTGPYWELDGPLHSQVFTVANLAKLDVLADIKGALQEAIDSGQTEKWFKDQLVETLQKKGWWGPTVRVDPDTLEARMVKQGSLRRLQTIYRTNLQSAYMAGRHRQALEQIDRAPWAQYLAVMDHRTRPAHAALNGKVFRLDSAAWGVVSPPNGYNCRCRARYFSDGELSERGLTPAADVHLMERQPPGKRPADPLTGETPARWVQRGVSVADPTREGGRAVLWADPGWDHIPGSTGAERALADQVLARAGAAGPRIAAEATGVLLGNARVLAGRTAEFRTWAGALTVPRGELKQVGALTPQVVQALEDRGRGPASAALAVRDEDVLHTQRDSKTDKLPWDWYLDLPTHLAAPRAVLLDKTDPAGTALLLVFDLAGATAKLVVKVDYEVVSRGADGIKRRGKANILRSGRLIEATALRDPVSYELLDGRL